MKTILLPTLIALTISCGENRPHPDNITAGGGTQENTEQSFKESDNATVPADTALGSAKTKETPQTTPATPTAQDSMHPATGKR